MGTVVTDNFDRYDSTPAPLVNVLENNSPPDGWVWQNYGFNYLGIEAAVPEIGLLTDYLTVSNGIGWRRYLCSENLSPDHGVELDTLEINTVGEGHTSLLLRGSNGDNFYSCQIKHKSGYCSINVRIGGINQELANTTITPPVSGSLPFKTHFRCDGTLLRLYYNTTLVLSVIRPSWTSGLDTNVKAGISHNNNADPINFGGKWDDFLAGDIPPPDLDPVNPDNPDVQCNVLNDTRRSALIGGRQDASLDSAMGLDDTVTTAKIGLIGD